MGVVYETILAAKQNLTGGGFEALTPGTDDTFVIRDYVKGSNAYMEEVWGLDAEHVAQLSIASPRMNDGQFGLRLALPSGTVSGPAEEPEILFPGPGRLPVYNADTVKIQASGTANDDVVFALSVYYENLEGSDVQLATWDQVEARLEKTFGILVQPTNGECNYGAPVALNSVDDRLEADKKYALLGAVTDIPTCLIAVQGPDTGRYRVGIPGKVAPVQGADWFVQLDRKYPGGRIPVIKANNAGSTLISTVDANAGASPNVTLILGQLAG